MLYIEISSTPISCQPAEETEVFNRLFVAGESLACHHINELSTLLEVSELPAQLGCCSWDLVQTVGAI